MISENWLQFLPKMIKDEPKVALKEGLRKTLDFFNKEHGE